MKKLLPLLAGVILTTLLVTGCGTEVKAYTDPQEEIGVSPDNEFVVLIALDSNRSTGYSWQANYDESMLELVEETYKLGKFAKQGLIGAGGTELFHFKALRNGEAKITMVYKRYWQTEILQQKVFTVEVK